MVFLRVMPPKKNSNKSPPKPSSQSVYTPSYLNARTRLQHSRLKNLFETDTDFEMFNTPPLEPGAAGGVPEQRPIGPPAKKGTKIPTPTKTKRTPPRNNSKPSSTATGTIPKTRVPFSIQTIQKPSCEESFSRQREAELINDRLNRQDDRNDKEKSASLNDLLGATALPADTGFMSRREEESLYAYIDALKRKVQELTVQSQNSNAPSFKSSHDPLKENYQHSKESSKKICIPDSPPSSDTDENPKRKSDRKNKSSNRDSSRGRNDRRNTNRRGREPTDDESESSNNSGSEESDSSPDRRQHRRGDHRQHFRCEMDKWPIKFNGSNVQKFLKKLNRLQKSYDYDDKTVAKYFHLLMEGKASDWFWMYCDEHEDFRLRHLKTEIARVFKSEDTDMSLMTKMYERKQGRDTFEKFYYDILDINSLMQVPLSDAQIIEILRCNMDDEVRQRIFTYETRDRTKYFHKANKAYKDVMKAKDKRREAYFSKPPMRKISEIEFEDLSAAEIEEITNKVTNWKNKRAGLTCFICKSPDHLIRECPNKPQFCCYSCGLEGYIVKTCPKCSVNHQRSAEDVRNPRS